MAKKKAKKKTAKKVVKKDVEECPFSHIEPVQNLFGRPTKLNKEIIEKSYAYIDKPFYETYTEEVPVAGVGMQVVEKERPAAPPTVVGLASELMVRRETLYDWAKKTPYFSNIMESLKLKREQFIVEHGLTGKYNSAFAKFILINTSEYDEKKKVEHSTDQNKPLTINIERSKRPERTLEDVENS